jgi:hypothetical protein
MKQAWVIRDKESDWFLAFFAIEERWAMFSGKDFMTFSSADEEVKTVTSIPGYRNYGTNKSKVKAPDLEVVEIAWEVKEESNED